ncbi:MAG: copper-binding protein [Nitrospirota bacterium]|nr:copper-binding protein [Nitrospirota bacterium]
MDHLTKRTAEVFGILFRVLLVSSTALADGMGDMNGIPDMSSRMGSMSASTTVGHGEGVVEEIDRDAGTATIKHGPIKEFGWSGMIMTFGFRHRSSLDSLKKGERFRFDVVQDSQGPAVITKIRPVP